MSLISQHRLITSSIHSGATFSDWTGERSVPTLGTAAGTDPLAFQRWRNFKEAFAPEIVERAFRETPGCVRHIADPFGGSGTTALAAQFLGAKPSVMEVNPFLADLIEAKIASYDLDQVGKAFARVCREAASLSVAPSFVLRGAPKTFVEPGVNGRYLFSRSVVARINSYRQAIERVASPDDRRLFKVLLGSILVEVSNVLVSGKGRRYKKQWQARVPRPDLVDELFQKRVLDALYDLRLYENRACKQYSVFRGDCRVLLRTVNTFDLAVFSPPYPNSFDYTDVYNVELWGLGYLTGAASNWELRTATLRSHVQIQRDMQGEKYPSRALSIVLRALCEIRSQLWNPRIPEMVSAYFCDMGVVMSHLRRQLRPTGRIYVIVGDSRYGGIDIPVAKILAQMGPSFGLQVLNVEACRSMRTSPQQGGQQELNETLLVFEKTIDQ